MNEDIKDLPEELRNKLAKSLLQSANGETVSRGSFAKYSTASNGRRYEEFIDEEGREDFEGLMGYEEGERNAELTAAENPKFRPFNEGTSQD